VSRTFFIKVLAAYFLLNFLVIGVQGDFPLNDEWMYGLEVQKMLESGNLHLYGGSPACAAHIVVGALVCNFTGFSYVTLRVCSLVFAFVGCVLLYGVLRQLKIHRREATLAAFVLASNPLYVNLSFCYMTDVPALCYTLMYMMLVIAGLKRREPRFFLAAALPLLLCIAVRQNSALFAIANGLLALLLYRRSKISALTILLALVAAPMGWAYGMDKMMTFINEYPSAYDWYKREISRLLYLSVSNPYAFCFLETVSTVRAGAYLGLFCWPLLAGFFDPTMWLRTKGAAETISHAPDTQLSELPFTTAWRVIRADVAVYAFGAMIITLAATAFLVVFQQKLMPFSPNLLLIPELGPVTIIFTKQHLRPLLICITAVAAWVAYILIFTLACSTHRTVLLCYRNRHRLSDTQSRDASCFFVMIICGLSFSWSVFHSTIANLDRYFLAPLVFVIPCVLMSARWLRIRCVTPISVVVAVVIALYSTCAQHDYLSWSRARWQAISALEAKGLTRNQIDGGIEYNYSRDPALSNDLQLSANTFKSIHRGGSTTSNMRWWSINGERFIVSLCPIPGYRVDKEYPYFSTLSGGTKKLLVLVALP